MIARFREWFGKLIGSRCKKCGSVLDYEHSGYNGIRPYCHTCKEYAHPKVV